MMFPVITFFQLKSTQNHSSQIQNQWFYSFLTMYHINNVELMELIELITAKKNMIRLIIDNRCGDISADKERYLDVA